MSSARRGTFHSSRRKYRHHTKGFLTGNVAYTARTCLSSNICRRPCTPGRSSGCRTSPSMGRTRRWHRLWHAVSGITADIGCATTTALLWQHALAAVHGRAAHIRHVTATVCDLIAAQRNAWTQRGRGRRVTEVVLEAVEARWTRIVRTTVDGARCVVVGSVASSGDERYQRGQDCDHGTLHRPQLIDASVESNRTFKGRTPRLRCRRSVQVAPATRFSARVHRATARRRKLGRLGVTDSDHDVLLGQHDRRHLRVQAGRCEVGNDRLGREPMMARRTLLGLHREIDDRDASARAQACGQLACEPAAVPDVMPAHRRSGCDRHWQARASDHRPSRRSP